MGAGFSVMASLGHAKCKGQNGTQLISVSADGFGSIILLGAATAIFQQQKPATLNLRIQNGLFQTVVNETRNLTIISTELILSGIYSLFVTELPAGTYEATITLISAATIGDPPTTINFPIKTIFNVEEPRLDVNCDNCTKSVGLCSTSGVICYTVSLPPRTLKNKEDPEAALPKTTKVEILNACSNVVYTKLFSNVTSASDLINDLPSGKYTVRATTTDTLNQVCVLEETCCIKGPPTCCFRSPSACKCKK